MNKLKTNFAELKEQSLLSMLSIGDMLVNSKNLSSSVVISSEEQKSKLELHNFDEVHLKQQGRYVLVAIKKDKQWIIVSH